MIKVGVMLSGCGVEDGSEIYEAVLTILELEKAGVEIVAMAPDVEQAHVVNHYTGQEARDSARYVLTESARITRGKIVSVQTVSAHGLDALILVGGFGAAKNLCTYASDGARATVNSSVERLIGEMHGLGKPIGAMCIASVVVALALQGKTRSPLAITIGNDEKTAGDLQTLGVSHNLAQVGEICVDSANQVFSTPAFMLANGPLEAQSGIAKLVQHVVGVAQKTENVLSRA